jgi:hypothetical protein
MTSTSNVPHLVCVISCAWENKKSFDIDFVVTRAPTTSSHAPGANVNDPSCAHAVSNVKCTIVAAARGTISTSSL